MRVLRSHQRVVDGGWRLCCARRRRGEARFAVVVAKKHVRRACARNRMRRVLREYFRQELCGHVPPRDYLMQSVDRMPPSVPSGEALRARCRALFEAMGEKTEGRRDE